MNFQRFECAQGRDEETGGRRSEEPRRFRTGNGQGIAFVLATVLDSWARDPNVERCTKAAAATQNAIASSKTGKRAPRSPGSFSRGRHGTASSKEPGPVPSRSGVNTLAARPPTPAAAHPSALPSPPSSPSCVSDASRLFAGCQSPRASCCFLYCCNFQGTLWQG